MSSITTTGARRVRWGCARVCMDARGWVRVCVGMQGCAQVYAGVRSVGGCAQVCASVHWCAMVCTGVCRSAWVSASVCVWDDFSEYLLENRVPTSADFNTYPIRIFNHNYLKSSN